jgi:hypothetical protein
MDDAHRAAGGGLINRKESTKMTTGTFDRGTYGAMSVMDLATQFERIVGEAPEKRNKLWMLKRMEQAFAAREAASRAVEGATNRDVSALSAIEERASDAASQVSDVGLEADVVADGGLDISERGLAGEQSVATATEAEPFAEIAEAEPRDHRTVGAPAGAEPTAFDDAPGAAPAIDQEEPPHLGRTATGAAGREEAEAVDAGVDVAAAQGRVLVPRVANKPERRQYIPLRFRAMTLPDLHALYEATVGRPTKSVDVPYLAWKIKRAEQQAGTASLSRRRPRVTADGAPRGDARAVTLREYPDTLAALKEVCTRRGFRTRLEFFRRAACCYLRQLGETAAAEHFTSPAPEPPMQESNIGRMTTC